MQYFGGGKSNWVQILFGFAYCHNKLMILVTKAPKTNCQIKSVSYTIYVCVCVCVSISKKREIKLIMVRHPYNAECMSIHYNL
jgi:hypothetical protein